MASDLSFAAFDVETANPRRGSICAMGVAIVRGGVRVGTHTWLCRPPSAIGEFSPYNMRVHRITPDDVAGQPGFAQRLPEVLAVVGDLPVVAHNAAFDMDNLTRACAFGDADLPDWLYGCTYTWSKRQLLLEKYRLPYVAGALGVVLSNHHDAGADAAATADIAIRLAALAGVGSIAELALTVGSPLAQLGRARHRVGR
ncbi:DNA polymerase III subunit epsilon [Nocardia beijingensis]|uniref:exonuclease domain-containing protein n=1 Tax=Nocardia beijingensis TaxID=95162 RepID=UPI0018960BEC|nr:exonuclease domain-containing protein [Nocardia beijingensis]MBF6466382.1 DNA polymerase III subunit epsilon [Nocardia beijingensis]